MQCYPNDTLPKERNKISEIFPFKSLKTHAKLAQIYDFPK